MNSNSKPSSNFAFGDHMLVDTNWGELPADKVESVGVNVFKLSGEHITGINTRDRSHSKAWKDRGHIGIDFELTIAPGSYYVLVEVFEAPGKVLESGKLQFMINKSHVPWSGLIELPYEWYEKKD